MSNKVPHPGRTYTDRISEKETGEKHFNEKFHNLYSSRIIIVRVIKSRRMSWAGHIVCMGQREY
jgi:hypothetical protein